MHAYTYTNIQMVAAVSPHTAGIQALARGAVDDQGMRGHQGTK